MSDLDDSPGRGSKGFRLVWAIILLCASLGVALFMSNLAWGLLARGEKVTATCTEVEHLKIGTDSLDSPIWHVTFPTARGTNHKAMVDASFAELKAGDTIEVLYDPRDPSVVQPNRWLSLWGWPRAATFVSLCSFIELLRLKKKNAASPETYLVPNTY